MHAVYEYDDDDDDGMVMAHTRNTPSKVSWTIFFYLFPHVLICSNMFLSFIERVRAFHYAAQHIYINIQRTWQMRAV